MNAATTARTTNQSAAIALLAAASAKPAAQSPRDDSFAQALSNVNQSSSKGEAGLFAARQQPADTKPKAKPADEPAASNTNSNAAETTQPSEADAKIETPTTSAGGDKSATTSAATTKTAETAETQQLATGDIPSETPLLPIETAIAAIDAPAANADRKPVKTDRANAATSQSVAATTTASAAEAATEVAATPTSAASEADEAVTPAATKRAPTDPLRLIQPSEQAPITRETAIASKSTDAAATNPDAPIAARQPNQNAGNDRNANAPAPQAFGLAQPGKTVPQSPIAGPGTTGTGTIGGSTTSNTSTSTIGAPRVDPSVVPPRLPGGRAPETPITLKLTARSLPTGEPGTTQTEADAAATQIARGLGAAFRNKGGQLTLWMNPESLGKLRVQMTIDNGTISARFEATSEATKNLLAQNVDALRSALESRGLSASSIEIVSIPDWSKQNSQPDTPGYKAAPGDGSPNQPGTNHNSAGQQFSHQGNARDDMPPKLRWLREPELANATPSTRNEPVPQINVNERLLAMNARLEIDAIA